ncbi:hypothetical protein BG004_000074 [Podila humilis]|nr:hypothetical protein BG004_000074 [Podila humilis]
MDLDDAFTHIDTGTDTHSSAAQPVSHLDSKNNTYLRLFLLTTALALFLWIAREYPAWKAQRLTAQATDNSKSIPPSDADNTTNSTDRQEKPSSKNDENDSSSSSIWPAGSNALSLRWLPYLPFAVIYLLAKALWTALRSLILHSLFLAEQIGMGLLSILETVITWSFEHGPHFIQDKIVRPLATFSLSVFHSPALAKARLVLENSIFPALVKGATRCQELVYQYTTKLVATVQHYSEPIQTTVEWVVVECVYNPGKAISTRLKSVGYTFLQTAKVYLNELWKDAKDLGYLIWRVAQWIWERTLQPLTTRLYALGEMLVRNLIEFVPWLVGKILSTFVMPVGKTLVEGFKILRSHPTLLSGLQAVSRKVQEKGSQLLEKLESINWLVLLETVLTRVVTFTYKYTTLALSMAAEGIRYFAVEMVPNAYTDLLVALGVAKPVVEWMIHTFLKIVNPLWQVVSWLSSVVYKNTPPALAALYKNVVLPIMHLWETKIMPVMGMIASGIISQARTISQWMVKVAPALATIFEPFWVVLVKCVDGIQRLTEQVLASISVLALGISERVQKQMEGFGPRFESFKTQTGVVVDDLVVGLNNFMVDWVKKEKRE